VPILNRATVSFSVRSDCNALIFRSFLEHETGDQDTHLRNAIFSSSGYPPHLSSLESWRLDSALRKRYSLGFPAQVVKKTDAQAQAQASLSNAILC
jgi:hypothetical protein